jgi:hypothetical protein
MIDALIPRERGDGDDDLAGATVAGLIASPPDASGRVFVTIPSYDPSLRHGPCPVMPRGAAQPARGDRCLVVFTDEAEPWVVAWEPA